MPSFVETKTKPCLDAEGKMRRKCNDNWWLIKIRTTLYVSVFQIL
jgi:hypothetical protein